MRRFLQVILLALPSALAAQPVLAGTEASARAQAVAEIQAWRSKQQANMRGEKSPLAVERVVILRKAENTIGSDPQADVRLDAPGVERQAAVAILRHGQCVLRLLSSTTRINGDAKLRERALRSPDRVAIGPYRLQLRRPEGQFALRISNINHPALKAFHGLDYYAIDLAYRVPAVFHKYATKRHVTIDATQGGPQDYILAGYLEFQLNGQPLKLDALIDPDDPDILFIIFTDRTNGQGSYKIGRYIDVKMSAAAGAKKPPTSDAPFSWNDVPDNVPVALDFNQSYNPLCSYGPFFFCPIPPKQNRLPVSVPAGQKDYQPR